MLTPCFNAPNPATRSVTLALEILVLYSIAVVLLVLWVLGVVLKFTAGGLLHILLVVAVIMVVYNLITGRRSG